MLLLGMSMMVSCNFLFARSNDTANSNEQTQNDNSIESSQIKDQATPDLTYFELKGPVKMMNRYQTTYEFDEDGTLILIDGLNLFDEEVSNWILSESDEPTNYAHYTRNEEGYISEVSYYEGYETNFWENGRVVKTENGAEGVEWSSIYEYDETGELVCITETIDDFGEITVDKEVYDIQERDQHGNWIKRKVTVLDKDQQGNWVKRNDSYGEREWEETRSITYY